MRIPVLAAGGLAIVFSLVAVLYMGSLPNPVESPEDPMQRARTFRMHNARPDLGHEGVMQRIEASDDLIARLTSQGVEDVGKELHERMRELDITEEQRLAFYQAHQHDIFGGRSYARSQSTVDRLIRLRAVRAQLQDE